MSILEAIQQDFTVDDFTVDDFTNDLDPLKYVKVIVNITKAKVTMTYIYGDNSARLKISD